MPMYIWSGQVSKVQGYDREYPPIDVFMEWLDNKYIELELNPEKHIINYGYMEYKKYRGIDIIYKPNEKVGIYEFVEIRHNGCKSLFTAYLYYELLCEYKGIVKDIQ